MSMRKRKAYLQARSYGVRRRRMPRWAKDLLTEVMSAFESVVLESAPVSELIGDRTVRYAVMARTSAGYHVPGCSVKS